MSNENESSELSRVRLSLIKSSQSQVPLLPDPSSRTRHDKQQSSVENLVTDTFNQPGKRVIGTKLAKVQDINHDDIGMGSLCISVT